MNQLSLVQRLALATLALLSGSISLLQMSVHANASSPQLVISQFKVSSSNGQFFMLYNNTGNVLDMTKFELQYFNNIDISKSTSSKLIELSGSLPAHGYYLVSDAVTAVCYQAVVQAISLDLSSTSGMIEVMSYTQSSPGASIMPTLQDYVGWSKTAAPGAQTLPSSTNAFLQRLPVDSANNPNLVSPGTGSWQAVQPDPNNPCKLTTVPSGSAPAAPVASSGQLLPSGQPAATFITLDPSGQPAVAAMAASNIGLKSPTITEILPNPSGTGNDSSDEFIELYNDNDTIFDLSGFSVQTGIKTLRTVTFPSGTVLAPKTFRVFYAKDLALSLSNASGQVILIELGGTAVSETDSYGTAKDGQTWALANGKWFWTTSPTPGAANIVVLSTTKKASIAKPKAKTVATKPAPVKAPTKTSTTLASKITEPLERVPIHAGILALIAGVALLYGAYEYRTDMGNKFIQLRGYLGNRRGRRIAAVRR